MAINGPKRSEAIETCAYLISELRISLYSVLQMQSPTPNVHNQHILYNTVKVMPTGVMLALLNPFHVDHHEDSRFTTSKHQISRFLSLSGFF